MPSKKSRGPGNPNWVKDGPSPNPSGKRGDAADHPIPELRDERADGTWSSGLTGIGDVSRDKRMSHRYKMNCALAYQEIAELWEKNDLVAKAIEGLPAEVFREGYDVEISDEGSYDGLKEDLEDKLEELGADEALERAFQLKTAFGGAAIMLGARDNKKLWEPLVTSQVKSLDWLNVLEPMEIYPVSHYGDPNAAKYGQPEFYEIGNYGAGNMYPTPATVTQKSKSGKTSAAPKDNRIHESRLIVFNGIQVSRYTRNRNATLSPFWGASAVDRFIDALRDFDVAMGGAGIMATDSGQPVITIEGLMGMIAKNEEKLRARFAAIEMSRSVARAIVLDSKEKYERQTTNFQGLPEILDRLSIRAAAATGQPLSVLLGYSPTTLGAPSDSEMVQWFNTVRSNQRRKFAPPLLKIIQLTMPSLRQRKIPKKIEIRWNELERMNDAQTAEARLNQARTDSMNIKSGMLTSDEARKARFHGKYSFETAVKEKEKAPGFIAPLPAGVMPGSTPGAGGAPGAQGVPGAPKPMGPNAHSVGGYARRNPTQNGLGANAKEGGDVTPTNRDARRDAIATYAQLAGMSELEYQQEMLDKARASGADDGVIAFLEDLVHICELEEDLVHICELEAADPLEDEAL